MSRAADRHRLLAVGAAVYRIALHAYPHAFLQSHQEELEADFEEYNFERQTVELLRESREKIFTELSKVIIGQKDIVEQLLITLIAGGHCLITGAPGLAKTLLVRSIAQIFHLKFQRIQFTPDLMPADITGASLAKLFAPPPGVDPRTFNQTRFSSDFHSPYSLSYSLGIQRRVGNNQGFEVRYVRTRAIRLAML